MKVADLIKLLQEQNQEAIITISVGCYFAAPKEVIKLDDGSLMLTDGPI